MRYGYGCIVICGFAIACGCSAAPEETTESEEAVDFANLALTGTLPNAVTPFFIPPHVGGDKEFKGHGPAVYLNVSLAVRNGNQIWTTITMDAIETTSDWTRAQGSASYLLVRIDRAHWECLERPPARANVHEWGHTRHLVLRYSFHIVRLTTASAL